VVERAPDRLGEPRLVDGLEQVVERVDVERAHRELVVGGDEDDRGRRVGQERGQLEPRQLRHLHVDEQEVGAEPLDQRERLEAVAGLADQLDRVRGQHQAQPVPRQRLVVDDDRAHHGTAW
jgi:hypothetical protein